MMPLSSYDISRTLGVLSVCCLAVGFRGSKVAELLVPCMTAHTNRGEVQYNAEGHHA